MAQFTVKNKLLSQTDFTKDTIFIELKSFTEKETTKYKKQDILEIVETRIKNENETLQKEISLDWGNKSLVFLDESEIENRIKNNTPTLYLAVTIHNDRYFDKRVGRQRRYYYFQHYDINLILNKRTIVSVPLTNAELTRLDLHFALSLIDYCVTHNEKTRSLTRFTREVNTNSGEISKRILLVSSKTTDYSEKYLKTIYGSNLSVQSPDDILEIIHSNNSGYVYLIQSLTHSMDNPRFNHFIVRTEDSQPVLLYRNSSAYVKPCSHSCFFHKENEKLDYLLDVHFRKFKKIIETSNGT
jgi:hypothetical protein